MVLRLEWRVPPIFFVPDAYSSTALVVEIVSAIHSIPQYRIPAEYGRGIVLPCHADCVIGVLSSPIEEVNATFRLFSGSPVLVVYSLITAYFTP